MENLELVIEYFWFLFSKEPFWFFTLAPIHIFLQKSTHNKYMDIESIFVGRDYLRNQILTWKFCSNQ